MGETKTYSIKNSLGYEVGVITTDFNDPVLAYAVETGAPIEELRRIGYSYVEIKPKNPKIEKIVGVLDNSDIVWTKYGADTKEELAQRILKGLEDQ